MFLFGSLNVEGMRKRGNVRGLIKALHHREWKVRCDAARALGDLKAAQSVDALVELVLSEDERLVRENAALALGKIGDRRAYEALLAFLHEMVHPGNIHDSSALALQLLGDRRAVEELFAIVRAGGANGYIVRALQSFQDPNELPVLLEAYAGYRGTRAGGKTAAVIDRAPVKADQLIIEAISAHGPAAIPVLVGLFTLTDWRTNQLVSMALESLHWVPTPDRRGALFHICRRDWDAAVAVGEAALEPLVEAAQGYLTPDCRVAACRALGRLGDERAAPALCALLSSVNLDVQLAAIHALGQLQAAAAMPHLAALARDPRAQMRRAVVQAISQIPAPGRADTLIEQTGDLDPQVRARALDALDQMGVLALPALATAACHASAAIREYCAVQMGRLHDPACILPLTGLLKDSSALVRRAAAYALVQVGSPDEVAPLLMKAASRDVLYPMELAPAGQEAPASFPAGMLREVRATR